MCPHLEIGIAKTQPRHLTPLTARHCLLRLADKGEKLPPLSQMFGPRTSVVFMDEQSGKHSPELQGRPVGWLLQSLRKYRC